MSILLSALLMLSVVNVVMLAGVAEAAEASRTTEVVSGEEAKVAKAPQKTQATEAISDEDTPLGAFDEPHCWVHWIMLLGVVSSSIYGVLAVRRRLKQVDDIDNYEDQVLRRVDQTQTVPVAAAGRQAL